MVQWGLVGSLILVTCVGYNLLLSVIILQVSNQCMALVNDKIIVPTKVHILLIFVHPVHILIKGCSRACLHCWIEWGAVHPRRVLHGEGWVRERDQEDRSAFACRVPAHWCSCHHSTSGLFVPLRSCILQCTSQCVLMVHLVCCENLMFSVFTNLSLFSATPNLHYSSCWQESFPCWKPAPRVEHTGDLSL